MSTPNRQTLNFYRRLLHTMMKTFNGDPEMFHRCRIEARQKIMENKDEQDPVKIQDHIFFGEEVRDFFNNNLIAGKLQENGNYRFKARKEHAFNSPMKEFNPDEGK